MMLLSNNRLLRKIIEDGLFDSTKPRDRFAIFLKLNHQVQRMIQNQLVYSEIEHPALEFLKHGLTLVKAKSRFTTIQTTVSYETET